METSDIKDIVKDLQNTSMRMKIYTFILGIGTIAEPRVRRSFVEQYVKTFIEQLYDYKTAEFRAEATRTMVDYFMNLIQKETNK